MNVNDEVKPNVPHHLTQADLQTSLDMAIMLDLLMFSPKPRRAWGQRECDCYIFIVLLDS